MQAFVAIFAWEYDLWKNFINNFVKFLNKELCVHFEPFLRNIMNLLLLICWTAEEREDNIRYKVTKAIIGKHKQTQAKIWII